MLRAIGRASGIAFATFFAQAVFATETRLIGQSASQTAIPYPGIGLPEAGAALLVLLPVSIALQILLRLARDPEQLGPEDAVAQRQFWGNFAGLVAAGSAFVALCAFVVAFIATGSGTTLDLNQLFGVPIGAIVAMLLSADAAASAERESDRLQLAGAYRDAEIRALEHAAAQVGEKEHEHPRRRLIRWASIALLLSLALAGLLSWLLLRDGRAITLFTVMASILTLFVALALPRAATAVLRGKPLDIMMQILPPALILLLFGLQLTAYSFTLIPRSSWNEPWAYLPGIAYGLLIFLPIVLVSVLLTTRVPRMKFAAPLLDYSRSTLESTAERLRKKEPKRPEFETWEIFAWSSICTCLLPFVSFPLAGGATFHRARSANRPRRLFLRMWICIAVVAALEIAALLLLPLYATSMGWLGAP